MSDAKVPELFQRKEFDVVLLNRNAVAAEGLERSGGFRKLEDALQKYEKAVEECREIQRNPDLSPEGREKQIRPRLAAAQAEAERIMAELRESLEQDRIRAQADIDQASRPPAPESVALVAHEVRVSDARRQLVDMEPHECVSVVLSAAQAGDLIPTLAAERSYKPLVPAEVLKQARQLFGEAVNQPAAKAIALAGARVDLAERLGAQVRAVGDQAIRTAFPGLAREADRARDLADAAASLTPEGREAFKSVAAARGLRVADDPKSSTKTEAEAA